MSQTSTVELKHTDQVKYNKRLIFETEDYCAHDKFGEPYKLNFGEGERSKWRRIPNLPDGVELTEGVNPTPVQLSKEDIYADLKWFGQVVQITERVNLTNQDDVYFAAAKVLGRSAGKTRDTYIRGILNAGTNVYRANGVATRANIVTKLSKTDLDNIILAMQNANAEPYLPKVTAGTGVSTAPIPEAYIVYTTFNVARDLKNILGSDWIPVQKYAAQGGVQRNEMGAYDKLRFVASTNAMVYPNAGGDPAGATLKYTDGDSSHADIHSAIVLSKEGYGVVSLANHNPRNIIKPAKEIGGALEMYGTSGYKMALACAILDQAKILRYEVGVSA